MKFAAGPRDMPTDSAADMGLRVMSPKGQSAVAAAHPPQLDVVLPARGETDTLVACLDGLLRDSAGVDLKVFVVANGPERAVTIAATTPWIDLFRQRGVELRVLEDEIPSKTNALDHGDRVRRDGSVLYLDADVMILPGTIRPLATDLAAAKGPLLTSPRPRPVRPTDPLSRSYVHVWTRLPAMADDVMGGGCYAVNAAGRERWGTFPNVLNDDSFVRGCFDRSERRLAAAGGFLQIAPEGKALVSCIRRWRVGNLDLRALPARPGAFDDPSHGSDPSVGLLKNLAHVLSRPDLWLSLPGFTVMMARARLLPRPKTKGASSNKAWLPSRPAPIKAEMAPPKTHSVAVVVRNASQEVGEGWRTQSDSAWIELEFAPDGRGPYSYVLIVDGAAPPAAGLIDEVLAVALRFPTFGAYVSGPKAGSSPWAYSLRPLRGRDRAARLIETGVPNGVVLVASRLWPAVGADDARPAVPDTIGQVRIAAS